MRDRERLQQTLTENNLLKEENRTYKEDLEHTNHMLRKVENELSDNVRCTMV